MQTYHRFPIDEFYGVLNTDEQGFSGAEAVARLQHYDANDPLYRTAITDFFSSIIICQVADVIICRSRRQSLFTVGVLSNRLVLLGIAAELALLALIA